MNEGWIRPPRLRTTIDAEEERHATWLELLFDLVFVAAVAQLATRLADDTSLAGFLRFAALFLPVAWAWTGFTFYANRFDTDDVVYRAMKSVAMLAVAAVAVNLPTATTPAGSIGFALSYVAVRCVLLAMYARARRHVSGPARSAATVYMTGFSVGASLWLVSALVPTPVRYWLWAAGLAVDLSMPLLGWRFLRAAPINASHITERYGLFFIIVLGESVFAVVTGTTHVNFTLETSLVAAGGLAIVILLWWIYFDLADTSVIGRGMLGLVYMYGHFPLLAGVIALGAGTKLAIEAAAGPSLPIGTRWAVCGGVAVFLLCLAVFHVAAEWTTLRDRAFLGRLALAAGAIALASFGASLSPLALVSVLAVALLGQLLLELLTYPEGAASVWHPNQE